MTTAEVSWRDSGGAGQTSISNVPVRLPNSPPKIGGASSNLIGEAHHRAGRARERGNGAYLRLGFGGVYWVITFGLQPNPTSDWLTFWPVKNGKHFPCPQPVSQLTCHLSCGPLTTNVTYSCFHDISSD